MAQNPISSDPYLSIPDTIYSSIPDTDILRYYRLDLIQYQSRGVRKTRSRSGTGLSSSGIGIYRIGIRTTLIRNEEMKGTRRARKAQQAFLHLQSCLTYVSAYTSEANYWNELRGLIGNERKWFALDPDERDVRFFRPNMSSSSPLLGKLSDPI